MQLEKIYLLFTIIDKAGTWPPYLSWEWRIGNENKTTFSRTMLDGLPIETSYKIALAPPVTNEFWEKNLEKVIIFKYGTIGSKRYLTLCYVLKSSVLPALFPKSPFENNGLVESEKLIQQLFIETVPDIGDLNFRIKKQTKGGRHLERVNELTNYKLADLFITEYKDFVYLNEKYSYLNPLLIVMPVKDELKKLNNSESIPEFLQRFELLTHRNLSTNIYSPYWYYNFIETLPSNHSLMKDHRLRVFIRTRPREMGDRIDIPESLMKVYDFEITLFELSEAKEKIGKVYSNGYDMKSYIDKLHEKDIFKNYVDKYKHQRIDFIETKFETENLIHFCKHGFEKSVPWELRDSYERHEFPVLGKEDKFVYSILRDKNNEFQRLLSSIETVLNVNIQKDEYFNEYIRDSIAVESNWANLRLQKAIKKLTWVAIVIGLLAIVASIFGNEIKSLINSVFTFTETSIPPTGASVWRKCSLPQ